MSSSSSSSSEIDSLLDVFHSKNLIFQPDFENLDPSKHLRYGCKHPIANNLQHPGKEILLKRKWARCDENGTPNAHFEKYESILRDYLKNYSTKGVDFLESTILEMMNLEKTDEQIECLPGLRKFFKLATESEQELMKKFAIVVGFALRVADDLCPQLEMPIYRCVGEVLSVTFTGEECAVLLAWMFFETEKNRSFLNILTSTHPISIEKIKFLLHYFSKIHEDSPRGVVSFSRIKNENFMEKEMENSRKNGRNLVDVTIRNDLLIEQTALCTQVDFANKHIGGGVLRLGGVQEEIRFLMCPEMIVSMLLFDKMKPDEAISIVGARVYSSYTGYSGKLKWRDLHPKDALQNEYRDKYGRIQTECLAINAIKFFGHPSRNLGTQLQEQNIRKELMKAGVGFAGHGVDFKDVPICTGWWGCGAYSGNKQLKFLIQLLAASLANRPLIVCTFGESALGNKCQQMKRRLDIDKVTVGELYDLILQIPILDGEYPENHVFDSIEEMLCRNGRKDN